MQYFRGGYHAPSVNFNLQPPIITSVSYSSPSFSLVEGTADPGAYVRAYLSATNCPTYPCQATSALRGSVIADANGNWSMSVGGYSSSPTWVMVSQAKNSNNIGWHESAFSDCMQIDCQTDLYLTAPYNTVYDFEAANIITADNVISGAGANVTYDAGNYIDLLPDFEVVLGAEFHAFIDGCGNFLTNDDSDTNLKENSDVGTSQKTDTLQKSNAN